MSFLRNKTLQVFVCLLIILLASVFPLFEKGFPFTHDFVHGSRVAEMARGISDGHLPVIWSSNFGFGYGMPLFEFYAPLPFYVAAGAYLLGFSLVVSVKIIFFLAGLLTVMGSYLLGKQLYGRVGGLVVAAAISLAPYRALNLFIRGAISEVWGITAAIWILLATVLVIQHGKKFTPLLMVSIAALLLSHNLVTIIFLPTAALFSLIYLFVRYMQRPPELRVKSFLASRIISLAISYMVGLGLSVFYWLPAFTEKGYTKVEQTITGNYFDFHLHFLYIRQFFRPGWGYGGSEWGPYDPLSFFLGYGQLAGIAITLGVVAYVLFNKFFRRSNSRSITPVLFFVVGNLLILLVSALFSTEKSVFIWESVNLLKFIQFPWRFLSSALIFIGILAGAWTLFVFKKYRPYIAVPILLVLVGVNWTYFKPEKYLRDSNSLYYADPVRIQRDMSSVLPDYIPSQMYISKSMEIPQTVFDCSPQEACTSVILESNKVQYKKYAVEIAAPVNITFPLAYYPGWHSQIDGTTTAVSTNKEGHITLNVEPGVKMVELQLGDTFVRKWSTRVSLFSGILFISWSIFQIINSRLKKSKE